MEFFLPRYKKEKAMEKKLSKELRNFMEQTNKKFERTNQLIIQAIQNMSNNNQNERTIQLQEDILNLITQSMNTQLKILPLDPPYHHFYPGKNLLGKKEKQPQIVWKN